MVLPARLLLVEDDATTLRSFSKLLRTEGYRVEVAGCIREALEVAAAKPVDLLLCDIGLPDGSGVELMRTLFKMYNVTGIAISGYGEATDIEECKKAGFTAHLLKPISFEMVQAALQVATRQIISCPRSDLATLDL